MANEDIKATPVSILPQPSSAPVIKAAGDAEVGRIRANGQVKQDLAKTYLAGSILLGLVISLIFCALCAAPFFKEYATAVVPTIAFGVGSLFNGNRHPS
jgi:hypothetical protein